jgi:catechol 2,3-dioxygenase-like lactoylglutathione lyase family enzyme
MTTSPMTKIECEQHHTGLFVSDLKTAIDFYTNKLGFRLGFEWGEHTTMAGVNLGHVQIFLERGEPSPKGCYLYFVINDADAFYEFHRNNGVEVVQPIADRNYGLRDYAVRDLHGYVLSFGHRLPGNCDEEDEEGNGDHS